MMDIRDYIDEGTLKKEAFIGSFTESYMRKSRKNLRVMRLLHTIQNNNDIRKQLELEDDFNVNDWVIVIGYYGMYMASQAALAKIGYVAKSHAATIAAIKTFYVDKKLIEPRYLKMLEEANIKQEQVKQLREARAQRQTAQYGVSISTTEREADKMIEMAYDFVNKFDDAISK